MGVVKKILVPFVFFAIAFMLVGELNIWQKWNEIVRCDYYYDIGVLDSSLEKEYIEEVNRFSENNDIYVYAVSEDRKSMKETVYTIYADDEVKQIIKQKLQCKDDITEYSSLISGKTTVVFKPLAYVAKTDKLERYYAYCSEKTIRKFRSETIDKYGTSKAYESDYSQGCDKWIIGIWATVAIVICMLRYFEYNFKKKKILVQHLNGSNIYNLLLREMLINTLTISASFILAFIVTGLISAVNYFFSYAIISLCIILIVSNVYIMSFVTMDIKKTLTREHCSKRVILLLEISTVVILIVTSLCLSANLKSIHDALLTLNQDNVWKEHDNYSNVYFTYDIQSKKNDFNSYCLSMEQFYENYMDEYKMKLIVDVANNGTESSIGVDMDVPLLYVNKYGVEELSEIGVDASTLKDDYYVISKYSKNELEQKGILDEIEWALECDKDNLSYIQLKSDYKVLTLDVTMDNLSDNYKKNPVMYVNMTENIGNYESGLIFASLVKFHEESDYERCIEEIGYKDEIYYQNNVYDLYKAKAQEKKVLLIMNLVVSLLMILLYNVSFATTLRMDFDSRAEKVAIGKVLGNSIWQRYRRIFCFIVSAYVVSTVISVVVVITMYNFSVVYLIVGNLFTFINMLLLVAAFIKNYESKCIVRVLKGGN